MSQRVCHHESHNRQGKDQKNDDKKEGNNDKMDTSTLQINDKQKSGGSTSAAKDKEAQRIAQFQVIKSVEQIINFTDTASDGTNRMSANHLKIK